MDWKFDSCCWLDSVDVSAVPVQVVGSADEGVWWFANLVVAQRTFPELDPYRCTDRFTWAMRGEVNGTPALRFETWAADSEYSL